jgi:CBS domain-containing protein
MSHQVVSLDVTSTVDRALALARERNMHHFPVVREGRLVGFVCTCDLHETLLSDTVGPLMRTDVATVSGEASTRTALSLMNGRNVGSLLIVENETIHGIITRNDLAVLSEPQTVARRALLALPNSAPPAYRG